MRLIRFQWLRLPVLACLALLCTHCGGTPELKPPISPAASVGSPWLRAVDSIDDVDLAVGTDGAVHLVWFEKPGPYDGTTSGDRIVYRRGQGDPVRWDPPVVIATEPTRNVQVVATRERIHVFGGLNLRHWSRAHGASAWQNEGELLGEDAPGVNGFDAVVVGDAIVVAYIGFRGMNEQALYSLRWSAGEVGESVPVATLPPVQIIPAPQLLPVSDRLLLVWGGDNMPYGREAVRHGSGSQGRMYAAWSEDAGRHWEQPVEIGTPIPASTHLDDQAVVLTRSGPIAFFARLGVYASRWRGDAWSPPQKIADPMPGQLAGSAETPAMAAATCDGHAAVAWIDGRYQRSDRRWWSPLGGFPWSDSPDWYNNDVFVLSGPSLQAALDGTQVPPQRQTNPGERATKLAMAGRGDHLLLVWAGRAGVAKSPNGTGRPPEIFQQRIVCE